MRKIFVFLSVLLLLRPVYAGCVSASSATKCARLPTRLVAINDDSLRTDWKYSDDGTTWSYLIHDHQDLYMPVPLDDHQIFVSGTAEFENPNASDLYFESIICTITSPFYAQGIAYPLMWSNLNPAYNCAYAEADMSIKFYPTALPGDACPDGFYTVPYDVSCGEGMIDTADIPNCDNDTSGEYCLMANGVSCESYSDCGDMSFTNANGVYTLSYTACNGGMCSDVSTTDVACGNGYYGNGTTCTKCPGDGTSNTPGYTENNDGTLAIINNASLITDCYVTPNVYFRDGVGKYRFRNNCNYAE